MTFEFVKNVLIIVALYHVLINVLKSGLTALLIALENLGETND